MTDLAGDFDEPIPLAGYRSVVMAALLTVLALLASFGGWAILGRLDAAFVTTGVLHSDSERKTVESLEGGILAELLVRPGDRVTAGQVVARLDATQVIEQIAQIAAEREQHLFAIWRLEAERAGRSPDPMHAPSVADGIAPERRPNLIAETLALHASRTSALAGKIDARELQIAQLENQIAADSSQANSADAQLRLWTEEYQIADRLIERGAVPRVRLLELERAMAVTRGNRDESRGMIRAAGDDIARARAEIDSILAERNAEMAAELIAARMAVSALESRLRAAQDVLRRHDLRAPQTGRVVDISIATPGAILGSGVPLMTILPEDDQLVALLKAPPAVIDNLHIGDDAEIRLIAYRRVDVPTLPGTINFVSADQLEDERTGQSYFEVRVGIDQDAAAELDNARLLPGMPIEVTVRMGTRRAGDYLLEPILRFTRHALREE